MRLTLLNFFKKSPNGHIFRGKQRLVKPVSMRSARTLQREYELQERNMFLLMSPYLSMEESSGHAKALGKPEKIRAQWKKEQLIRTMRPNVTIEERLAALNVKRAWD